MESLSAGSGVVRPTDASVLSASRTTFASSSCHLSAIRGALGPLAEKRSAAGETHGISRVGVLDMKLMSRPESDLDRPFRTSLACFHGDGPSSDASYVSS